MAVPVGTALQARLRNATASSYFLEPQLNNQNQPVISKNWQWTGNT